MPVCDKHRLADWQIHEANVVVKCFNRFPNPKHLKFRERGSVKSFHNNVYFVSPTSLRQKLQVCRVWQVHTPAFYKKLMAHTNIVALHEAALGL